MLIFRNSIFLLVLSVNEFWLAFLNSIFIHSFIFGSFYMHCQMALIIKRSKMNTNSYFLCSQNINNTSKSLISTNFGKIYCISNLILSSIDVIIRDLALGITLLVTIVAEKILLHFRFSTMIFSLWDHAKMWIWVDVTSKNVQSIESNSDYKTEILLNSDLLLVIRVVDLQ